MSTDVFALAYIIKSLFLKIPFVCRKSDVEECSLAASRVSAISGRFKVFVQSVIENVCQGFFIAYYRSTLSAGYFFKLGNSFHLGYILLNLGYFYCLNQSSCESSRD